MRKQSGNVSLEPKISISIIIVFAHVSNIKSPIAFPLMIDFPIFMGKSSIFPINFQPSCFREIALHFCRKNEYLLKSL